MLLSHAHRNHAPVVRQRQQQQRQVRRRYKPTAPVPFLQRNLLPTTSYNTSPKSRSALGLRDTEVGQGTLIWTGGNNHHLYNNKIRKIVDDDDDEEEENFHHHTAQSSSRQQPQTQQQQNQSNERDSLLPPDLKASSESNPGPRPSNAQDSKINSAVPSYGLVEEQTLLDPNVVPLPPGHFLRQPRQQHPFQHKYNYGHGGRAPITLTIHIIMKNFTSRKWNGHRRRRGQHNIANYLIQCCCSCLLTPLYHCIQDVLYNETLHRSFCYGAIDGMLTGAGIVSTFCGMNMLQLNPFTALARSSEIRAVVVVFTAAACFADSVCMALGHVWTTHILAAAQERERADARTQIMNHRVDAKGMLVDMLLQKGMLKIDAISIADTLDGYPDLLVSALTGESLTSPSTSRTRQYSQISTTQDSLSDNGNKISDDAGSSSKDESNRNSSSQEGEQDIRQQREHDPPINVEQHHQPDSGLIYEYRDDNDPDLVGIRSTNHESKKESFFMMMGFSLFAVVPSLIYTLVPTLLCMMQLQSATTTTSVVSDFSDGGNYPTAAASSSDPSTVVMFNPNSVAIVLTASIMWCLGVWKSRFLDSNWIVFGFEAVSVLLVCIVCAYGLGALLNHWFLPNEYQITVITAPSPSTLVMMKTPSAAVTAVAHKVVSATTAAVSRPSQPAP